MIDRAKLAQALDEIEMGRISRATRLVMESGAAGVELSPAGIERAMVQKQEAPAVINHPAPASTISGCRGCRGL
jgi:hypothetical protein